jgi:hypothetical protein
MDQTAKASWCHSQMTGETPHFHRQVWFKVDLYSSVNLRVLWLVLLEWSNGMGKPWPWFMWLTWLAQVGSKAQHLKDVQMPGHLSHYCQGIVTTPQPLISHCSQRSKVIIHFFHSFDCICWIKIHMTGTLLGTEDTAVRKPKSLLHGKNATTWDILQQLSPLDKSLCLSGLSFSNILS